jgi:hypothetical protein
MRVVAMLACPSHSCHFGGVGLVVERIGRGGRTQRMGADLEAQLRRIGLHERINGIVLNRSAVVE